MIDFSILGFPRSGTSLIRAILNKSDKIYIPPEASFATYFYEPGMLLESKWDKLIEKIMHSRKFSNWNIDLFEFEEIFQTSNYQELVNKIYLIKKNKEKPSAKFLGDKNNTNILNINKLISLNPDMKFILILRDPISIYHSFMSLHGIDSELAPQKYKNLNDFYIDYVSKISKLNEQIHMVNSDNLLVIKFEDLIINPGFNVSEILAFLGVENFNFRFMDQNVMRKEEFDEPVEFLKWKSSLFSPIDKDKIKPYSQEFVNNLEPTAVLKLKGLNAELMNYVW